MVEKKTVAKTTEIKELEPFITEVDGTTIGIYRLKDRYYAYANTCSHQGGPCVEGDVRGNLECRILPKGELQEYVSNDRVNIVCPWHGIEYALEDGVCRANRNLRLLPYEVIVEGDDVKVTV